MHPLESRPVFRPRNSKFAALVPLALCVLALSGCGDDKATPAGPANAEIGDYPGVGRAPSADVSVPGGVAVVPLARGVFVNDFTATFRLKETRETHVVHVDSPSDVLTVQLTFQPDGSVGWHTHNGPVIVTVASGALTLVSSGDCTPRVYQTGQSFVDPGQGHVHLAYNATAGQTVLYATFLDAPPAGQAATIPAGVACNT